MTNEQRAALEQAAPIAANKYRLLSDMFPITAFSCGFKEGAEWMEQNQWIPVTERLPEEEGYHRVTIDNGAIDFMWFFAGYKQWGFSPYHNVVAWIPNPAPYSPPKTENNG